MDSSFDLPDPSDWLNTPVSQLSSVENALRCRVCKDFFNTPMITSCSHTFCSLCIRRCLTTDGQCPACRSPDQEMRLRLNSTVQELVDAFRAARPTILQLGEQVKDLQVGEKQRKRKRKRLLDHAGEESAFFPKEPMQQMETRSRSARNAATPSDPDYIIDNSTDDGSEASSVKHGQTYAYTDTMAVDDGLSACPICNLRMKEEEVFPHLDIHNDPPAPKPQALSTRVSMFPQSLKPLERLPRMNYSLLKDNALRKKLAELGIPSHGPKPLLVRRHTEWVNLVNSNCDSQSPRTKRELLHDLDVWDKTQGRHILNGSSTGSSSVMSKDFDGPAWVANHNSDFKKLIAEARKKVKPRLGAEEGHEEGPNGLSRDAPGSGVPSSSQETCGVQADGLRNGVDETAMSENVKPMNVAHVEIDGD